MTTTVAPVAATRATRPVWRRAVFLLPAGIAMLAGLDAALLG